MSHSTTSGGCSSRGRGAHERDHVTAFAQAFAQAPSQVDAAARAVRPEAPRAHHRQGQAQPGDQLLRRRQLGRRHGVEVHALQHFAR